MTEAVFVRRTLIVIGLIALTMLAWMMRDVLLMVFGAVVIATLFRSLAKQFERLRIPAGLALALSVLTVFAVVGIGIALFGAQVVAQAEGLSQAVPKAWASLQQRLAGYGLSGVGKMNPSGMFGSLSSNLGTFVMSLGGGIADTLLIVVGGIFIAASPRFYGAGALKMVPAERRQLMSDAMSDSGRALQLWLKAQLVAMLVIGVLTGLGLWLLGVPSALALGLLAGLLEFVPFAGPILSAIPAVLIALALDPQLALWTVLLYVGIQHIEGYALQPIIQSWAVEIPGAVLLFALLAFGGLFGPLGIIFAAPLTVVVFVMVKRLYVREALDTATPIPGEDKPADA
ncbi:AI-2E family transporter [Sphingomonas sp. BN140010]|uniref:AI-2E family transporter n=1 Tax=Sphingomonas arvum TaxID=2992113 RepID=A0ABT3JCR9_9SPHN|nr:AI-2E family transporter [Sphingomonas sp. BN140010]MCW3796865.1 AI-2E family transporter [Sphingomonas sp. BN140010]